LSAALDLILSRLPDARSTGSDRWRDACPVCGERNRSTLSIGLGDTGVVLLKCFKLGCDPEAIATALGLDLSDLFPPKESHGSPVKRRRLLTAAQALDLLDAEAQFIGVIASNIATGVEIDAADRARVLTAAGRIAHLRDEVLS
jgi:hypothetical protein